MFLKGQGSLRRTGASRGTRNPCKGRVRGTGRGRKQSSLGWGRISPQTNSSRTQPQVRQSSMRSLMATNLCKRGADTLPTPHEGLCDHRWPLPLLRQPRGDGHEILLPVPGWDVWVWRDSWRFRRRCVGVAGSDCPYARHFTPHLWQDAWVQGEGGSSELYAWETWKGRRMQGPSCLAQQDATGISGGCFCVQ